MKKAMLALCPIMCGALLAVAQPYAHWNIPFKINGQSLPYATVGGLNNPQVNEVDLNADGTLDLFILDRTGNVPLPFINEGQSYRYAPNYARFFPEKMVDWVLMRDFNGDGVKDIFTQARGFSPAQGVAVFAGYYEQGHIAFDRVPLDYPNNIIPFKLSNGTTTQLYVSNIDYPSIDDIDCDGDLDILTFNPSGGFVELYANQSVEEGYGLDSLLFELEEECWGGIFENSIDQEVGLAPSPGECFNQWQLIQERHPGSTLLTFDAEGDGDKDLLLGDITFSTLNFLTNEGSCEQAWINDQEVGFPSDDVAVDVPLFPVAFLADVTFDGHRDLLAAPNSINISEDQEVLWLYENTGTSEQPSFQYVQRDFLVGGMVDLGTGASPAFVDYNADGLLDLVVGNGGAFEPGGERDSRLFLFENVGTSTEPAFELVDEDYLGLSAFDEFTTFAPAFGDLDGDGDQDVLVGEVLGKLFYAENTAGPGQPLEFGPWQYEYMDIDVGSISVPCIVDLDRDGLSDLVIGERTGNINFFKNIGQAGAPVFNPDVDAVGNIMALGNINTAIPGSITGYSAPLVLDQGGEYVLLTGKQAGPIEFYNQVEGNLSGTFQLDTDALGGIRVGARTRPALADLDNDGRLEVIIGNQRGGISAFQTELLLDSTTPAVEQLQDAELQVFPNPTDGTLTVELPAELREGSAELFNSTGQLVRTALANGPQLRMDLSALLGGLYYLRLRSGEATASQAVILK